MAHKTAPERVTHAVREIGKDTNPILKVDPVDAREMVASGAYEYADDPTPSETRQADGSIAQKSSDAKKDAKAAKGSKASKADKADKTDAGQDANS